MAIGSNSYGTVAEVAALTPLYATADDDTFDNTTQPTLTQVEKFIDRTSAMVNTVLAQEGFDIPVTQADAKLALDGFVVGEVAHWVEYTHGAGPFVPQAGEMRTETPQRRILRDAEAFITEFDVGLERLGATRTYRQSYGLSCRTQDESGTDLVPPFSVKQFDHDNTDWDT